MNSDVYIFGKLGSYYSQYPDDFTSEIFMKMGEWNTSADTYISVHRKGELMYYGYVRKLKADRYIGFCSVLNGVMVTDFNALFDLFDSMLHHLAVGGDVLKYSDSGEIVADSQSLVFGKPVLNQVRALLKDGVSGLSDHLKKLPPESYGISASESKQFDLYKDDMPQVVSDSYNYSYTFVAKNSGTPAPDSYQGVLRRLHKEKKELEATNSDLLEHVLKLKKEKKQQGVVFTVGAAAIICFFVLLGVMQSLDAAQGDLALSQTKLVNTQAELDQTKDNMAGMKKTWEEYQSDVLSKMSEKDRYIIALQKQNEQMATDLEVLKNENTRCKSELQRADTDLEVLKKENTQYRIELQRAGTEIENLENKIGKNTRKPTGTTSKAMVTINAPLRTRCSHTAPTKMNIPRYTTIEVFNNEWENGYYKVRYEQNIGYVADVFISFL